LSMFVLLLIGFAAWKLCYLPAGSSRARPELAKQWNLQMYWLDDDEVARLLPAPYPPQRMAEMRGVSGASSGQLSLSVGPDHPMHPLIFMPPGRVSAQTGTVGSATGWCVGISRVDRDIPQHLHDVVVDGDWVLRENVLLERRMKAVESILGAATGKQIMIEYKAVEREVIVARGDWHFHPMEGLAPAQQNSVQIYTDTLDARPEMPWKTKFAGLLDRLSNAADLKVINEVSDAPQTVTWTISRSAAVAFESRAALVKVLANLQKQTSLEFSVTRRTIPVWMVRERATTQPAGEL